MKVLVTGGAGFIGANFVRHTLTERHTAKIRVFDLFTYAGNRANLADIAGNIEIIEGDLRHAEVIEQAVAGCDIVVNLAAESHNDRSLEEPGIFFETNVLGTVNLANACVKHNVRLHHVSTDEVFGDLPLDSAKAFSADSTYRPSSPYSASKASSDHVVRSWIRSFGLRATISNCSNNYGPMQHREKLIPSAIKSIKEGHAPKLYGSGLNVRDWIHVEDHVDGIWAALERGVVGQTYLLGARDCVSNVSLVKGLLEVAGAVHLGIEFVADRPGHDLRYALDPSESERSLDWRAKHAPILKSLEQLFHLY